MLLTDKSAPRYGHILLLQVVGGSLYLGRMTDMPRVHDSVHKLSTLSLQWMTLSPSTSESGAPGDEEVCLCGMVAFRDGEEDILCVVAGYSSTK